MEDEGGEGDDKKEKAPAAGKKWEDFDGEDDDDAVSAPAGKRGKAEPGQKEGKGKLPAAANITDESVLQILDAWENESDLDSDEGGPKRRAAKLSRRKRGREKEAVSGSMWIAEDGDAPIDFMSTAAAHSFITSQPRQSKRQRGADISVGGASAENKIDALRRLGLSYTADGRLVVNEDFEEKGDADDENGGEFAASKAKPLSELAAKRDARAKAKAKARVAKRAHRLKGLDEFKPKKKSAGDARKQGAKHEPYAYIQLNPRLVKEKHKGKAVESLSKVIKGAKKGVLKGQKAKRQDIKMGRRKDGRRLTRIVKRKK